MFVIVIDENMWMFFRRYFVYQIRSQGESASKPNAHWGTYYLSRYIRCTEKTLQFFLLIPLPSITFGAQKIYVDFRNSNIWSINSMFWMNSLVEKEPIKLFMPRPINVGSKIAKWLANFS